MGSVTHRQETSCPLTHRTTFTITCLAFASEVFLPLSALCLNADSVLRQLQG